jgi:hypothetical protein
MAVISSVNHSFHLTERIELIECIEQIGLLSLNDLIHARPRRSESENELRRK